MAAAKIDHQQHRVSRRTHQASPTPKEEAIEIEGTLVEPLPNAMFGVELPDDERVLAHIEGKIRITFIWILPADPVVIEPSPYDLTRGRITYRYKHERNRSTRTSPPHQQHQKGRLRKYPPTITSRVADARRSTIK